jgi:hypothetical protein
VARDDRRQSASQRGRVQVPVQMECDRRVVEGAPRLELIQEPEAFLSEGEREPATRGPLGDDCRSHVGHGGLSPTDQRGQLGHRTRLEQRARRDVEPEGVPHAGDDLHRRERMTPQLEEIVVDSDVLEPQHLGPHPREQLLGRRAGRGELGPVSGPAIVRRRE